MLDSYYSRDFRINFQCVKMRNDKNFLFIHIADISILISKKVDYKQTLID